MSDKRILLSYAHIHKLVKQSAAAILQSGFQADRLVAVSGGGLIPARIMRTFIKKPIVSVSLGFYNEQDQLTSQLNRYQWLDGVDLKGKNILLIDEVDDTRTTLAYCLQQLLETTEAREIAVFCVINKQKPKQAVLPSTIKNVYYGAEMADQWICFPWDADDIFLHEKMADC